MPTGYTANVVDGKVTDFKQFALQCARAFGALIMMRDEPNDAEIPEEFKPDDYYKIALEDAKAKLLSLQTLTPEQMETQCAKEFEEAVALNSEHRDQNALGNERLEAMIARVLKWVPPSANHTEMKSFMLEQLKISKTDLILISRADKPCEGIDQVWSGTNQ